MKPGVLVTAVVRRPVQLCAAVAGVLPLLALLAWTFGDWRAVALGSEFVPMAPSTALAIFLLSCAVFTYNRWPSKTPARILVHFAVLGAAAMGLLVWVQSLSGPVLPIEGWPACTTDRVGHVPVGRMSPLTATTLLLCALAFWLAAPPLGRRWWCRQMAAVLTLAVLSIGIVVLLSYAAGVPLLYGTQTIPMALLSAVAFVLLALGLLGGTGADTFPRCLFPAEPEIAPRPSRGWVVGGPLLIFVFLSAGIGTVGYCYFMHHVAESREAAEKELSAIADMKVRQVSVWYSERLRDAGFFFETPRIAELARASIADTSAVEARQQLQALMASAHRNYRYGRILLVDRDLQARLAIPADKDWLGPRAKSSAAQALRSGRIQVSDLHLSRAAPGTIDMDIFVPLLPEAGDADAGREPAGVLMFEINPHEFLFPAVQSWPTPSPTAETLLVRREGDEVVYLNELRHESGTALTLRLPLDRTEIVAVRAVLGQEGILEGVDYRGVPVLAAARAIPGTPWFLVAKVDQQEVYAPVREHGLVTAALVLVFFAVTAMGVGLMGRRRDTRWLRSQLAIEREHRLILDSTAEGVLGLDSQGRCAFINPAACRMLGYEPEELIGKPGHDTWHNQKADGAPYPSHECPIHALLTTGKACQCDQEVFWRKDGTSFPVEYAAAPSLEKDRPVALVLFFRDVTERKQAELDLKKVAFEAQRFREALDYAPVYVYMKDPQSRYIYANRATLELFGCSAEELVGCDDACFFPPDTVKRLREIDSCVFQDQQTTEEIDVADAKGGRRVYWEIKTPIYTEHDSQTIWGLLGISTDITERKRAEEALRLSEEELQQTVVALESSNMALEEYNRMAEAATRAKSEFLANMSHEIRTPMTAILGYADLISEGCPNRCAYGNQELPAAVAVIRRNGEHLLELINDILDLSKVESGKMEISPVRCSPFDLLTDVAALMRVRAEAKGLKVETAADGPLPDTILTDPLRLRQVLINLAGNAIKFTDRGEVRITARLVADGGPPRLRFDVTDTGIGMSDEQMQKLFQPFSQVDASASRRFGGSGLGLAISKRLVEVLGGEITVYSVPGQGSTFSVMIDPGPLDGIRMVHAAELVARQSLPVSASATAGAVELHARVLLVEDGPDNQRLIGFLLKRAGADVTTVENGQLAVEAVLAENAAGRPFDVILMDMQMPVLDGYEATRALRAQGHAGPIVALTAHAMADDRQKCLDAGCDDYLSKPIDRQQLLDTVAKWTIQKGTGHSIVLPEECFQPVRPLGK